MIKRGLRVNFGYTPRVDVIKHPVIGLSHHGQTPHVIALKHIGMAVNHPAHSRMADHADTVAVCQHHRSHKPPQVGDVMPAGQLAVTVERMQPRPDWRDLSVGPAREDRADPGAEPAMPPWHRLFNHRGEADGDTGHICDRVVSSR